MGNARNLVFWVVLFLLVLALFNLFSGGAGNTSSNAKSYSEFVAAVDSDNVANVRLDGERIVFTQNDGRDYVTIKPQDANVTDLLISEGVPIEAESQEQSALASFLFALAPLDRKSVV